MKTKYSWEGVSESKKNLKLTIKFILLKLDGHVCPKLIEKRIRNIFLKRFWNVYVFFAHAGKLKMIQKNYDDWRNQFFFIEYNYIFFGCRDLVIFNKNETPYSTLYS